MLQRLAHPGTADKGAAGTGGGDGVWVRHAVHLTHAPRGLTARSSSVSNKSVFCSTSTLPIGAWPTRILLWHHQLSGTCARGDGGLADLQSSLLPRLPFHLPPGPSGPPVLARPFVAVLLAFWFTALPPSRSEVRQGFCTVGLHDSV